jgi:hypothetical protein
MASVRGMARIAPIEPRTQLQNRGDRLPRCTEKPGSGSCRLHAGRHSACNQVSSELIPGQCNPPVLTSSIRFRYVTSGSLSFISLTGSCPAFSLTLTTMALYQCSLRWFEACSCKPTSRGLPSSLPHLSVAH